MKSIADKSVTDIVVENLNSHVSKETDFNCLELDLLTAYIVQKHHFYIYRVTPIILKYAEETSRLYGKNYSEIDKIHELTKLFLSNLSKHLCIEENVVFPQIENLVRKQNGKLDYNCKSSFENLNNLIAIMKDEHDEVGEITRILRMLSNNYSVKNKSCKIYSNFYKLLQEFELDLETHTHLENNILFKKALLLLEN